MFVLFCIPWAAQAQQSLPYSYGFENNSLSADGWTTANPYNSNTSDFGIAADATHNGDYGFRFSSYSRNTAGYDQYLITPELDGASGVILSFWYAASSTYGTELFKVGYSTTDMNISSFTWGDEISTNSTSWAQSEEFMFPSGTKYVAIWYYSNYQYRLFVDDFSFTAVPSCVRPTLSNEVILGMENASVQWTENGTATNWELQYSTNADFSGATTINRNGIPVYNIRELSAATTYYARVRANCGGGDYSDWSNVITFTTWACENATVVEYNLTDSYGDGWNGNAIRIFDGCGDLVETLTITSGSSNSGTLSLCGDYYQFVWHTGSYASETSFTLTVNGTALYSQQSGGSLTDGQVLHTIGIQPPVMPTDLTAGTPGANEVQLSWTENGTATTWQICINDDENNLVVANSNPFTLTGLNAVTAYTVKVRSTDGTSASCWSNVVSFTTDSQCPTPNGLNVTNLMPTSATLNWQGEADSYNVRYGVAGGEVTIFEDGFENGLDNWTVISNGDYTETTWRQFNADNFGDEGLTNHNGSYVTMSRSYGGNSVGDVSVDNWLITPQVALDGDLKYWVINDDGGGYAEQYAIYVSTTGNSISDFTLLYTPQNNATTWTEHVVDLRSYNGTLGYIAIRHNDYGKDFLLIDDFGIYATQEAGEWINVTSTTNSLDITGLTSEVNYVFQVQADCGTEGESGWSASATFTTPDVCTEPTDLTAEVTGTAVKVSWTGVNDMYNLQYCEVDPTVPATIILNVPTDIWQDGTGYQMLLDADATAYGDVFTATSGWTATDYSAFEYLIPTDAECSADATHIVLENSVSIQIPAGTYDWCIVNPSPADSKIYIAASNGNVGGRQDDYVFEPGMTYEFTPSLFGSNDGVDVTVTDNNEWTLAEGVTNPYTLTNLNAETTYKYKVQGVDCDGNGNPTDWSESATFITAEEIYTVYFYEGTGDCGTVSLTGSSITLPTATINSDDWSFAGWSTAAVNESATAPATLVASPYAPAEDMPLYAVYAKNGVYSTFPTVATTQLDVTEGFETYAEGVIPDANGRTRVKPTGWTVVTQYDPKATTKLGRPQMRKAAYYAHEGQYSLLMDSLTLLAMPELEAGVQIQNVEMELYVKQMYDFQSLVVGVMSDLSDPSTFVAVTVINNVGEAINRRVIDFVGYEGTGRYIAFLNQYSEEHGMRKSFNYIDDITIRERVASGCGITSLPIEWSFEAGAETTSEVGSCCKQFNQKC